MSLRTVRSHVLMAVAAIVVAIIMPVGLSTVAATAVTARSTTATTAVAAKTAAPKAATAKKKPKSPRAIAKSVAAKKYKWKTKQYNCLKSLWKRESGWKVHAGRPAHAYGIPQALPGKKMGKGWRHSATAQIKWGLKYIKNRYNTPCSANKHQLRTHWY